MNDILRAVAGFTLAPWEHALAALRLAGPIQEAGLQLIRGNLCQDIHPERVSQADVVVIQRDFPREGLAYASILDLARQEGKPVILDMDDLLLELPEIHPDRQSHYYAGALFPVFQALYEADAVTASSQTLCEVLSRYNPNTWLLPNYLNDSLWRLRQAPPEREAGSPVTIGYMGGDSHLPDLETILPALLEIQGRYGEKIRFKFWGMKPPAGLSELPNVEWIPLNLQDYAEFARFFQEQECDIFIAPLSDSLFNRCKSPIKFLEYSSLGIPGVYSRITPYTDVVIQGENGCLASTTGEWVECLSRLILDADLRLQMGVQVQQTVRQSWLLSDHAYEWRDVYQQIRMGEKNGRVAPQAPDLEMISKLSLQIQDYQRWLETRLKEKEQEAQRLNTELTAIHQSNGWAFLQKLLRLRRIFIPHGSQREQFLQILIRSLK